MDIFQTATGGGLALLAVWIWLRCARSLLRADYEPETWGYVELPDRTKEPLHHWECVLGRSRACDVVLTGEKVERRHAAILRSGRGEWTVTELRRRGSVWVNGRAVEGSAPIHGGDTLRLGDMKLRFLTLTDAQRTALQQKRREPGSGLGHGFTLLLLTIFQLLITAQQLRYGPEENAFTIALSFALLIALEWGAFFVIRAVSVRGFEPEIIALFLTTAGFAVAASSTPEGMLKQSLLFTGGLALFFLLGVWLRELGRTRSLRWFMAFVALGLLGLNLLLSERIWGAKNWLSIAGQSLQPSEFVKIAYVYAGAATLDRLFHRRNIILFIGFSAACVGALALMGDFGTALVFFVAFLVITFLRSGSIATILFALGGAGAAAAGVIALKPYVASRFLTWGRAWESPLGSGYQQVRAMSALASGGLLGRGSGNGWLRDVVAADTDLVFGMVCEELGLAVGVCCMLGILLLAAFCVRSAALSRSSYYLIASCGTVTIFMAQMALNVFGSMDLLPFTGVTFPFVSRGGSSLISCWGMLSFIKAGDTRQSGSFALKTVFEKPKEKAPTAKKTSVTPKPTAKKTAAAPKPAAKKTTAAPKPAAKKAETARKTAPAAKKTAPTTTPAAGKKSAAVKKPTGKGAGK